MANRIVITPATAKNMAHRAEMIKKEKDWPDAVIQLEHDYFKGLSIILIKDSQSEEFIPLNI